MCGATESQVSGLFVEIAKVDLATSAILSMIEANRYGDTTQCKALDLAFLDGEVIQNVQS